MKRYLEFNRRKAMQVLLTVSTVLGGVAAVWFLFDKRSTIASWFKLSFGNSVNPLSLPDKEFTFFDSKSSQLLNGAYLPANNEEEYLCKSLTNHGLLKQAGGNKFKATRIGKKLLNAKNS